MDFYLEPNFSFDVHNEMLSQIPMISPEDVFYTLQDSTSNDTEKKTDTSRQN